MVFNLRLEISKFQLPLVLIVDYMIEFESCVTRVGSTIPCLQT